jgi:miniconductance mechanosensitive channel
MFDSLESVHPWLPAGAGLLVLLVAALAADVIVRRSLLAFVHLLAKKTTFRWDDIFIQHKVFTRVSRAIPALVVVTGIHLVPDLPDGAREVVENVGLAYLVLALVLALTAALSAANQLYETYSIARSRPLKGIVQILQLAIFVVGAVLIVSLLVNRSPLILLSGFGALTAVLLLVFKDTILGFVASVQLTANDMVRVGDWIEMPTYGADGDVLEVALHTVKIQNFDKTITTIPTYKLFSESFKNWRGMSESGGRRIKRAIHVDQSSIRFLTEAEIDRLREFSLLREHFAQKARELASYNASLGAEDVADVNRRRLTNIGVYRAYVRSYLQHHPDIHKDMTLLVRQLRPGPDGLPIEIYCFTRTTNWLEYEDKQSDIFDHVIAIVPEFGLCVFQQPAGSDVAKLAMLATVAKASE